MPPAGCGGGSRRRESGRPAPPGGVQQTIILDELWEEPDRALAHVTRRWHWDEDGSPAGEDELAWVFELRDGLISSWRSLEERPPGPGGGRAAVG